MNKSIEMSILQKSQVEQSKHELLEECGKLDDALLVLKMIMDAKLEGFALIKKQLQTENAELQSQLNKLVAAQQMEQSTRSNHELLFEKEKQQIQSSMKQLQTMYEQQKKDLQNQLLQSKKQYEFLQSQYDEALQQVKQVQSDLTSMEQAKQAADKRVCKNTLYSS